MGRWLIEVLALLCGAMNASVGITQSYPAKPVRVIVTSPTGGPPDIMMRGLAGPLREAIGQTLIVENMPGPDEIPGTNAVARAAPDGYTILLASANPIVLNPVLRANLPYDPQRDLAPVVMVSKFNSAFVVGASVPARTLKEFLGLARAKPGGWTIGTGGSASSSNIYAEWLRHQLGVDLFNVGYKTIPAALQGVVAGEVHSTTFALGGPALAFEKAGKLRFLAMLTEQRVPSHPNVPTMAEEGIDLLILNWQGVFAPARTPREVVSRLNSWIATAIADPGFAGKYLVPLGFERSSPSGESAEVFARFIQRDRATYERAQREAKLKVD